MELTEAETEYAVNVVKHIFDRHVVFQYNCTNTIPEQMLENVRLLILLVFLPQFLMGLPMIDSSLLTGYCDCGCFRSRGVC